MPEISDKDKWEVIVTFTGKENEVVKMLDNLKELDIGVDIDIGVMYDIGFS